MLLLLLVNFVSGFSLESMCISLIKSIRSILTHLHGFELFALLPQFIEIIFFICTKRTNLLNLKQSSDRLVIVTKGFLKSPNFHMLIKQKSPSLPRNFDLVIFGELTIVFSTKVNLLYLLYSTVQRCYLLHPTKQNCFLKTFLRTQILSTQVIFLPVFPSRTNPELQNISVTPKMVKKVIMYLDLSKASGPDSVPVVVLKSWLNFSISF